MLERFEDKYNWNKLSMTSVVTYFKVKTDSCAKLNSNHGDSFKNSRSIGLHFPR
jgi:hypothetical protein